MRVGLDRLPVRCPDDDQKDDDRRADGEAERERAEPGDQEHANDLLGRIRHGRKRVRRQHGEGLGLGQALVGGRGGRQRGADEQPFRAQERLAEPACVRDVLLGGDQEAWTHRTQIVGMPPHDLHVPVAGVGATAAHLAGEVRAHLEVGLVPARPDLCMAVSRGIVAVSGVVGSG